MRPGERGTADATGTEPDTLPDDTQEHPPFDLAANRAAASHAPAMPVAARLVARLNTLLLWSAFTTPLIIIGTLFLLVNARYDAAIDDGNSSASAGQPPAAEPPTPAPTVAATWPANLDFVPHTIPARIPNALNSVGAQHGYRFNGAAGDRWIITVTPTAGSGLDPRLDFYAPDGSLLASADDRSPTDLTAALTVDLPQDGMYRLVVESAQGGATAGAYLLTLSERDSAPSSATPPNAPDQRSAKRVAPRR